MIFLTWDEHRPEWGPHTHTKLSLYMKFFGHTKFFVGGVRRITQNSHTRVLEGIFAEDECNVCIYRAMQHTKINEGGIMQASDRWFLKIFFSSRSPKKKIAWETSTHSSVGFHIFLSDILSLLHLCWWAGFLCIYTMMIFFWNYNGKFLASLFEYFFWANF